MKALPSRPQSSQQPASPAWSSHMGALLLFLGTGCLLALAIPDWRNAIPWSWFHKAIPVWLMLTLAILAAGVRLLRQPDPSAELQLPGPVGPRFRHVILYTRDNCPLCDEALALLQQYAAYLPTIVLIDISRDPDLTRQHGTWIPVIEIDGRIRFRGRISELLLRRLIRMARPIRDLNPH